MQSSSNAFQGSRLWLLRMPLRITTLARQQFACSQLDVPHAKNAFPDPFVTNVARALQSRVNPFRQTRYADSR
jgi:hypothetical protein